LREIDPGSGAHALGRLEVEVRDGGIPHQLVGAGAVVPGDPARDRPTEGVVVGLGALLVAGPGLVGPTGLDDIAGSQIDILFDDMAELVCRGLGIQVEGVVAVRKLLRRASGSFLVSRLPRSSYVKLIV
jgi:hypothetical protein